MTEIENNVPETLPLRGGCWVARGEGSSLRIAQVKSCYSMNGKIYLDLYMYSTSGEKLGRTSPAMGGPRSFEPACDLDDWLRIEPPQFPLTMAWVPSKDNPESLTMGFRGYKVIPFGSFKQKRTARRPAIVVAPAARVSDYNPELEAAARRMAAQELRDMARSTGLAALSERASKLEAEAEEIAPLRTF